jgi:hypothetical protein
LTLSKYRDIRSPSPASSKKNLIYGTGGCT